MTLNVLYFSKGYISPNEYNNNNTYEWHPSATPQLTTQRPLCNATQQNLYEQENRLHIHYDLCSNYQVNFIAINEISGCRKGKENLKNKMK